MAKSPGFRAALLIGWLALGAAAVSYARAKSIPNWAAAPVLAAFLVEYPFYLVTGFRAVRERLAGPPLLLFLVAATVAPYLACCLGAVPFAWSGLIRLAALAVALGLWYVVLPANPVTDLAFLAMFGFVLLGRYFVPIYAPPMRALKDIVVLGHLSLLVCTILVLMLVRRVPETGYGFLPDWKEWRVGALHCLYFIPVFIPLNLLLKATHLSRPKPALEVAGFFLGMLLVVALGEEFLFRGVLQQWTEDWTRSRGAALAITSALFGASHIFFRFPNWRWAIVVAVLGWFCGRARNQAGSIRAGVVTHVLAATTWRAFFW